jgi:hypothetical protein
MNRNAGSIAMSAISLLSDGRTRDRRNQKPDVTGIPRDKRHTAAG